ncbi:DUF4468 domain-containing protein [Dysgonomonas sp. BGC7]|uniref:DUF4468 domain-containing protein n=1 Tax=Dysgonomonas sp. BGC7 TaxID=1658008 RepID=UPI0006832BDE|nr:DUF4468 domain-containing protein [Dysgonomonas sp. BGC7]MBD8389831.1 DUF4468 domain-containing protein [Dysgonomonas sp. BGC7]
MNKYLLLSLCAFVSLFVGAKDDPKYLAGAVPEIEGKVVFFKTVPVDNIISDADLFKVVNKWADENYKSVEDLSSRVLLADIDSKNIACQGEMYLVFKKSMLVLDRAKMSYQLVLNIGGNKCDVTIRNIRYQYPDSKESLSAEEMIIDDIAINKKKNSLNKYYDKFRRQTIDSVQSVFESLDRYLNGTRSVATSGAVAAVTAQPQPAIQPTRPQPVEVAPIPAPVTEQATPSNIGVEVSTLSGYKQVSADKIPGNYIKLLNDWTLITSGTADQTNVMTASWGGIGMFWEKPVAFCFLNPTRYSVQTMDKGEYYTISFYTEAYKDAVKYCGSVSGRNTDKIKGSGLTPIKLPSGATAFSEAWMIFECKKMVGQQLSPEGVVAKPTSGDWTKNGYHKMYIGEIVNVWIK